MCVAILIWKIILFALLLIVLTDCHDRLSWPGKLQGQYLTMQRGAAIFFHRQRVLLGLTSEQRQPRWQLALAAAGAGGSSSQAAFHVGLHPFRMINSAWTPTRTLPWRKPRERRDHVSYQGFSSSRIPAVFDRSSISPWIYFPHGSIFHPSRISGGLTIHLNEQ